MLQKHRETGMEVHGFCSLLYLIGEMILSKFLPTVGPSVCPVTSRLEPCCPQGHNESLLQTLQSFPEGALRGCQ